MAAEDIFVTKKCAVCGAVNDYYKKEELMRQMDYFAPDGEGAKAFFMLWHSVIEECPDCNYVADDISVSEPNSAMLVYSEKYKEIYENETLDDISEFEDCDAYRYDAYGFLNKEYGKNFESATGYLRAFFETRQGANVWYKEVGGFDGNDKEEQRIYKQGLDLSNDYLLSAQSRIMTILKKSPDNVESLFLLVYSLYYLDEKSKATALIKKLSEMPLSDINKKIAKYLYSLVIDDMFNWE